MKLTHKIADLITSGALSEAINAAEIQLAACQSVADANAGTVKMLRDYQRQVVKLATGLSLIRDMETPSCAHIGRRMSAVAREALK